MSKRYVGGLINSVPPTPSGPYDDSAAPGVWTMDQAANYIKQGLWPTAGNTNPSKYIENLFSTYLYTGNSSTQTITNGIDLAGEGGLVWIKARGLNEGTYAQDHSLIDTVRGPTVALASNLTSGNLTQEYALGTSGTFNSDGFTIASTNAQVNGSAVTVGYASWTFRKAPKFFDVVTYTGDGVYGRAISHNLESTPGCIIVKRTDSTANWAVWHRSFSNTNDGYMLLNTTSAETNGGYSWWGSAGSSNNSTVFYVGDRSETNASGGTYVAYLFAHDAGGFGDAGDQNVISCGSFTADGSGNATVTLGYEPQFVIIKSSSNTSNWWMLDIMRGQPVGANGNALYANLSDAEAASSYIASPTATGFDFTGWIPGYTYIYIAIRRGPMKTPTDGTSVFAVDNGDGSSVPSFASGFPVDFGMLRDVGVDGFHTSSRLTSGKTLDTYDTAAEGTNSNYKFDYQNGWFGAALSSSYYSWMFKRAPGFFDVVCYTGTGVATTVAHNLGVAPEMMIVKSRSGARAWRVYTSFVGNTGSLRLNADAASDTGVTAYWNNTTPTSSVFTVGTDNDTNGSGTTYVAYLFASVAGVSKVGSYTGTGTTLQVNCGFSSGARFVLIKRTDSTGDWYVWDSARGIVAGDDPYLLLNSTAAEVTNTDYVDTYSAGFEISSTAPAAINASGGTFIYLAIA